MRRVVLWTLSILAWPAYAPYPDNEDAAQPEESPSSLLEAQSGLGLSSRAHRLTAAVSELQEAMRERRGVRAEQAADFRRHRRAAKQMLRHARAHLRHVRATEAKLAGLKGKSGRNMPSGRKHRGGGSRFAPAALTPSGAVELHSAASSHRSARAARAQDGPPQDDWADFDPSDWWEDGSDDRLARRRLAKQGEAERRKNADRMQQDAKTPEEDANGKGLEEADGSRDLRTPMNGGDTQDMRRLFGDAELEDVQDDPGSEVDEDAEPGGDDDAPPTLEKCKVEVSEDSHATLEMLKACTLELKAMASKTMNAHGVSKKANIAYVREIKSIFSFLDKIEKVHKIESAFNKDNDGVRKYLVKKADELKPKIADLYPEKKA
eukprot:TRINITY_DN3073_c0_g1_i1.p1 TRINITY_DN3073_c0_g1~~TRINITY_DN3073_c0_g1_i1.p1  ORF type:complete len:378 (+),score=110.71 TRINITY_DN3073_c0_g1_i1:119-1252(+)